MGDRTGEPGQRFSLDAVDLGPFTRVLPAPPDAALDPYLDAAARCFGRFGVTRTSVPDVAAEAGVSRSTVYRLLGSVEDILGMLVLRDIHRFLAHAPQLVDGRSGPDAVIDLVTAFVTQARGHPILSKTLSDEPETLTARSLKELPNLLEHEVAMLAPMLDVGMQAGVIARRDPDVIAEWIARLAFSLILTPPRGALRPFVAELLEPVLEP